VAHKVRTTSDNEIPQSHRASLIGRSSTVQSKACRAISCPLSIWIRTEEAHCCRKSAPQGRHNLASGDALNYLETWCRAKSGLHDEISSWIVAPIFPRFRRRSLLLSAIRFSPAVAPTRSIHLSNSFSAKLALTRWRSLRSANLFFQSKAKDQNDVRRPGKFFVSA